MPIKIFIFSNNGYASIYAMQMTNFHCHFAGCTKENGLDFPSIDSIARVYGLQYYVVNTNNDIDRILIDVMKDDTPVLCEIKASINFDEIPKSKTIVNEDGTFSSSKLEYMYPFMDMAEHEANMIKE